LRVTHRLRIHVAGAELFARNGRPAAEVRVMRRQVHVRESRTAPQRSKAAPVKLAETNRAEAPAKPAIPGMEAVTRSKRKPADPAEAAKAEAKSPAETKE
jgi:hypothetical protein